MTIEVDVDWGSCFCTLARHMLCCVTCLRMWQWKNCWLLRTMPVISLFLVKLFIFSIILYFLLCCQCSDE